MTEAELLAEIVRMSKGRGLLWHHCRNSRLCDGHSGFPDLTIAGPSGIIFAELKTQRNDTTAGQERWLWTLGHSRRLPPDRPVQSATAGVWRPDHLEDGSIADALDAIK